MDVLAVVGGHLALDLVNTVAPRIPGEPPHRDWLDTPIALLTWAVERGVVGSTETDEIRRRWASGARERGWDARALADSHDIREALYGLLLIELGHAGDPEPARNLLSRRWAEAASRSTLRPRAGGPAGTDDDPLLVGTEPAMRIPDRLAVAAVDLLRTYPPARLKACPLEAGGCGWLFLDMSRNRSRRWCAMADCGTQVKARRLTERRRASRATASAGVVAGP